MLTSDLVRVRSNRNRLVPGYVNPRDPDWLEVAAQLLAVYRGREGQTRGELETDLKESVGDTPAQIVHQGLAKLLEDRCEFEVVAGRPPDELRELVFRAAAEQRRAGRFDRDWVLQDVSTSLGLAPAEVEQGLFADLKSEQRLIRFDDITPERLLQRYNVALAQAILLRAVAVEAFVHGETPQRLRHLLRRVKFHRLVCEVEQMPGGTVRMRLDGPLSLFTATQKYGLQLALFLPTLMLCKSFELRADVRWGAQKRQKLFELSSDAGLVSHAADLGSYTPPELTMFAELFRKRCPDWQLVEETEVVPLGRGFWVPDFRLIHGASGRAVRMEILGFWRRSGVEQHLARLREHVREPFLLAVSEQLRVEESELADLPAGVYRFRQMPLPDEVARLAEELLTNPRVG